MELSPFPSAIRLLSKRLSVGCQPSTAKSAKKKTLEARRDSFTLRPLRLLPLRFILPQDKLKAALIIPLILLGLSCQPATPSNQQKASEPQITESTVTFIAVGDMMLSRGVAGAITRANDPLLPFRKLAGLLRSTDFNFGNLESPISGNDRILGKGLSFNTHTRDVAGLVEYNFKVLNLANNHALDQRLPGLQFTQKFLTEKGITYLGVGDNLDEAWTPKIFKAGDIKIGFIGASYASVNDGGVARNDYVARIEDTERLKGAIKRLEPETDFIVVTMHAGIEYTRKPNSSQIEFAHAAIDHGADMVVGAHPHWVQTMEQYQGKYIFYSLGNFVFDQEWSRDTKEGLILKIMLRSRRRTISPILDDVVGELARGITNHNQVMQIELIPIVVENFSTPRPATEPEAQLILNKIGVIDKTLRP